MLAKHLESTVSRPICISASGERWGASVDGDDVLSLAMASGWLQSPLSFPCLEMMSLNAPQPRTWRSQLHGERPDMSTKPVRIYTAGKWILFVVRSDLLSMF